jgi:tetratricopeptide (TPR) repeat protein
MGVLAHQRGDSLEAMRYFDAVSKSNPGYAPIWYNRGAALQTLKRNDEALESYDRAISLDACYSAALVNRGAVLKEMSRQGEALETYNLLLGFDPDNDKALANTGILLTEFKRHDEAAETFAKLLQVNPEYENGLGLLCSAQMHACSWSELERRAAQIAAGIASGKRVTTTLGLLAVSDD